MKANIQLTYTIETTVEATDGCQLWQWMGTEFPLHDATAVECEAKVLTLLPDTASTKINIKEKDFDDEFAKL